MNNIFLTQKRIIVKKAQKLIVNSSYKLYRSLAIAALIIGGSFQLVAPVLAEGTTAGSQISNTATAEYNYINNSGVNVLNHGTSNTVTMTVAEVAGIVVIPQGVTDNNSSSASNSLYYDFLITNVGNDPTGIFIPGTATITGAATVQTITADLNSDGTFEQVISSTGFTTNSIPVNGTVKVRVTVQPGTGSFGNSVAVRLGNTGNNDNSAGTQNQPDSADGSNDNEVRTVTITGDTTGATTGETAGEPVNGQREASATQSTTVKASATTSQAFATLLLTHSNHTPNTSNNLRDDRLTYNLSLRVEDSNSLSSLLGSIVGGVVGGVLGGSSGTTITPADLVGTNIKVDSATPVKRILVSGAIPVGTHLVNVSTPPTGWTVVYTTDSTNIYANDALWLTQPPTNLNQVTRVGFIHTGPIAVGTTVSGLSFQIVTDGVSAAATTANVDSIAQVFGQTAGDTTGNLVYDESGDRNPDNYNDDKTPGSNLPTDGVAHPGSQGVDANNDNTGISSAGEVNQLVLALTSILNGPNLHPEAAGPTDNNDDFTNQSAIVPANKLPNSTYNPAPVTFTNTFSILTGNLLAPVVLVPVPPANPTDLPNGTTVTLSAVSGTTTLSDTYTYSNGKFSRDPSLLNTLLSVRFPSVGLGLPNQYTVTVDLPDGTPLSTDTNKAFPVTVRALVDAQGSLLGGIGNGQYDAGEEYNDTIDRVYTGFLKLVKESRILKGTGPDVKAGDETLSTTAKTPAPGNIIEYRITYTNISSPQLGSNNNSVANLTGIILTENGTSSGSNWALDNNKDGDIDTTHIYNTAKDPDGIVTYLNASASVADALGVYVTTYIDTIVGPLKPGQSGTFTFQRQLD